MNPDAKEFVPAHIMRKRQDEAALAKQMGDVDLDESKKAGTNKVETTQDAQQTTETNSNNLQDSVQKNNLTGGDNTTSKQESAEPNKETSPKPTGQPQNNQNNDRSKNHHEINGQQHPQDEDDRYLLKAGENYCEFNGEQFIIPGDDDEYENEIPGSDNSHPGYDFGNAEDNEDEDVINAYDAFLNELP